MAGASTGTWLRDVASDPLRRGAEVTVEDERVTVPEIDHAADAVAAGLLALGLQPGERVAVLSAARVASLQAWFGIARAGLVEVPLNPA
ncbi:MAG: AMP-binding protein, partial [Nocardioides sp.]|nr:AMP-binding protein [Nocardioides sp.]